MQAEKAPFMRPASADERRKIDNFCKSIGAKPSVCYSNLIVLEVPGGSFREVFDPPEQVLEFLSEVLEWRAYAIGYYIGSIGRRGFTPSLPLAHRLAPYCSKISCCILDDYGEKIFLYGKPVRATHITRTLPTSGPCLVLNKEVEALGWGRLKPSNSLKEGGEPRLVPVIDLGWYLRRGG
jgi:60S ribosome subunit biogenesis protein NIP7